MKTLQQIALDELDKDILEALQADPSALALEIALQAQMLRSLKPQVITQLEPPLTIDAPDAPPAPKVFTPEYPPTSKSVKPGKKH